MNTAPQELLKEYIKSQHFTNNTEIMAAMKEMFRDVIQTAVEVKLDEELRRERWQRAEASETAPNYRNGHSRKTVKTQLGEVGIKAPRDRNGTFEPKIIGKYSRNADGMEEKIIGLYALRQWYEPAGYRRADQGAVRRRDISGAGDKDPGEDHAGGDCVAKPAPGSGLPLHLYGRHPLMNTRRRFGKSYTRPTSWRD